MSRCPRGTDQRGAPVESLGRETFKWLEQKHSRGRSSPIPREAFMGENQNEERKSINHKPTTVIDSIRLQMQIKHAKCGKQMKKPRPAPSLVFDVFSPARS